MVSLGQASWSRYRSLNLHKTFAIPHGGGGPGLVQLAARTLSLSSRTCIIPVDGRNTLAVLEHPMVVQVLAYIICLYKMAKKTIAIFSHAIRTPITAEPLASS